jgi:hypothetical protein
MSCACARVRIAQPIVDLHFCRCLKNKEGLSRPNSVFGDKYTSVFGYICLYGQLNVSSYLCADTCMYIDILALVAALPPPEWQSRMVWLMESSPETSTTYP